MPNEQWTIWLGQAVDFPLVRVFIQAAEKEINDGELFFLLILFED
jgi:hypothetical protein